MSDSSQKSDTSIGYFDINLMKNDRSSKYKYFSSINTCSKIYHYCSTILDSCSFTFDNLYIEETISISPIQAAINRSSRILASRE